MASVERICALEAVARAANEYIVAVEPRGPLTPQEALDQKKYPSPGEVQAEIMGAHQALVAALSALRDVGQ